MSRSGIARGVLIGLAMVSLLSVTLALALRSVDSIDAMRKSAAAAGAVETAADSALVALQDAETGQRGFLLTSRQSYLEPYDRGRAEYARAIDRLAALAEGAPWLRDENAELRTLGQTKLDELARTIALMRTQGRDAALALVLTDEGKQAMDGARLVIARIVAHADADQLAQSGQLIDREQQILFGTLAASVLGTVLLGLAALGMMLGRQRVMAARAALQVQTDRLQGMADQMRDGVAVFGADQRLLVANAIFARVSGLPASLLSPGTAFSAFAHAAMDWEGRPLDSARPPDKPVAMEVQLDQRMLELWRSQTVEGGQMLVVADITRRTQAEAVARQAQKIESLGQLTGGVAHDFNNLLQVVSANLELIAARLPALPTEPGDWLRARLAAAQAGVERGARLTRHLLAFARRQPLAPEAIDVARLLRGMEDMLRRTLGARISLEVVAGGGLWPVRADPVQLENAVLNLTVNARDAMEAAGEAGVAKLTIEVSNASLDDEYAASHVDTEPGQYVAIAVTDTGTGMTAEQIARAIEPFYTTKPVGRGTGLGLSMVFGFAKQSGGHFKLYSEPGHGTTARLYIPRGEVAAETLPVRGRSVARARGELILVVEDDSGVRNAAVQALEGLGYRTEAASDATHALAKLRDGALCPDLLFTDVVMPGPISARALADEARAVCPGIAVVYTSGYTENSIVHNGQLDPGILLVSKPWRVEDLARKIRAALDLPHDRKRQVPMRVLLVEDDELVRMTTADLIAGLGHEVSEAATGEAALRLLSASPVDLLMTDVGLPDMDGTRLVGLARNASPDVRIIVASGREEPPNPTPGVVWLPKPYDSAALEKAFARADEAIRQPVS